MMKRGYNDPKTTVSAFFQTPRLIVMTTSNDFFSSIALPLIQKGYAVFPLEPGGKKPITQHGCKDATTDPAAIQAWAAQDKDANVGIHCVGMVVLDLDVKDGKNGVTDLTEIVKSAGQLPEHPVIRTPLKRENVRLPSVCTRTPSFSKWT